MGTRQEKSKVEKAADTSGENKRGKGTGDSRRGKKTNIYWGRRSFCFSLDTE